MEGEQVAEVRGVNHRQELEPVLVDIATAQYHALPGGNKFDKKSEDMKKVTALLKKKEKEEFFTKDDLLFLYEANAPIEGFGYDKDPRVLELRRDRNQEEDMLVIFDCTKAEIAHVPNEITATTKAYVGPLLPGVLQKLPENFEHVYTSFPDKKIRRENVEIGGKDAKQLTRELETAGINISDYAKDMLNSRDFVAGKREEVTLVRLTVADLGFSRNATTDQIYARAQELGLELCPPDTGPNYRLKYQDQSMNEWVYVGMKQIADRDGHPYVFSLGRRGVGLWLDSSWARPDDEWFPVDEFVFRLRKVES